MLRKRSFILLGVALAVALLIVFHSQILFASGAMLVNSETPVRADAALVLGGDYTGSRIMKGAELFRDGYVPRVLVSGGGSFYGSHESELAINFAVKKGFPREAFIPLQYPALSTADEMAGMAVTLKGLGIHRILLVTSPTHTGRATRVAHNVLTGIEIHPVACRDLHWHDGYWWGDREGRKMWLAEVAKNVAYAFGI